MFSFLFCIAQSRRVGRNQSPKLWGLGLFLCLWKLQKRFLHAKQTVSLVLYSFILASPLFCFLTSIKSRPFSLYREAWNSVHAIAGHGIFISDVISYLSSNYLFVIFIKIWIVNFEILNMKYSSPLSTTG